MLLKVFPTLRGWCSNCVFVIKIAILFYINVEEAAWFSLRFQPTKTEMNLYLCWEVWR